MILNDTILATSSPEGSSGVRSLLRLSGPDAWALAQSVIRQGADFTPGWRDIQLSFDAIELPAHLLLFQAPRSFTGQQVAELHLPNSSALLDLLTQCLLQNATRLKLSARLAEPGEFSARAFFNGKIDLTQAEGIAATINAASQTQLRAAAGLREGDLHRWTRDTTEKLAHLLAMIEAGIDFADEEDIHFIDAAHLRQSLAELSADIRRHLDAAVRIDHLAAPPTVVFIGLPNVGKSSLINALAGRDRSIVSPVAGTTRDTLSADLHTSAGTLRLIDVPGEEPPTDELRQKMMATRHSALLDADLIVEVLEATSDNVFQPVPLSTISENSDPAPRITIRNKSDLLPTNHHTTEPWQLVSAKTGCHIPELRETLIRLTSRDQPAGSARLALNHRHRELLLQSLHTLSAAGSLAASDTLNSHPELIAAELRLALDLLGQITGTISPDDVLGRIFSQFCIGK